MTSLVPQHIAALDSMKKYPSKLFYRGDLSLLDRPKVSIVGTRRPSLYTQEMTKQIARSLAKRGVCVVSGAAMGVDALAHEGAGVDNTIAVLGCGLDIRYPAINAPLIEAIENKGLLLSPFDDGFRAANWSFVVRNEIVVALGEMLIVTEADLNSGSLRSVEFAKKMGKKIYVLPHRIGESRGTHTLIRNGEAEVIWDVEAFACQFGVSVSADVPKDDFFYFCQKMPTLDEALQAFGTRVYEAELQGEIVIQNGLVCLR
ncbi:Rossmann fold nucleotide-binding protein Smf possibly involved in DNA uptake [hydrothermal vent metagenome]|uniref:Rossmann fold nucleotide-binding protein Smf possibly involved in DNA uptake n=1 Tax=hydrothermal vent metagenome TaxID=652676 RepID=A0A1W1E7W5_9ZZZZ